MSTLESQYKKFIKLNPRADLSFEEWKKVNARLVKQALINMMKDDEELGLYDESREIKIEDIFNDEKRENIKKFIDEIKNPSEPNQALKEAAKNYKFNTINAFGDYESFIAGAKWQQETLYNEEEVIDIAKQAFVLGKDFGLIGTFKEWFDTVKKK